MKKHIGRYPYVIAEIGANHNGDLELAKKMILKAKEVGCDCVKFQSFDERLFAESVYQSAKFLNDGRDVQDDLLTAVRRYSLQPQDIRELSEFASIHEIDFSSSAFELDHVDELVRIKAKFIKIASMDITNPILLRAIGGSGLPVILSTGMATVFEIGEALDVLVAAGASDIMLLHCVSLYPPKDDQINLNNIHMLEECFGYPVGFSDHSLGADLSIAAVAKGAKVIEKHFTLDKSMEGWDHAVSADPGEMAQLVHGVRRAEASQGGRVRRLSEAELKMRDAMRRSIVAARSIPKGKKISLEDLTFKRPGTGINPMRVQYILGLSPTRDIIEGSVIAAEDLGLTSL